MFVAVAVSHIKFTPVYPFLYIYIYCSIGPFIRKSNSLNLFFLTSGNGFTIFVFLTVLMLFLQMVLLGAEEGLFSLCLTQPGKHSPRVLPGVESAFQIDTVLELGLVIMIAGTNALFISPDLFWVMTEMHSLPPKLYLVPKITATISSD